MLHMVNESGFPGGRNDDNCENVSQNHLRHPIKASTKGMMWLLEWKSAEETIKINGQWLR